ncbi:hypothetical protein HID58_035639, partial [Brassica napus]
EGIKPLAWNVRLKIAREIADAVTYLHTQFPRIIIHRDLKLNNIFLDENWTAKLSSFSLSIPIPEGESCVIDIVCGTSHEFLGQGLFTKLIDPFMLNSVDDNVPDHSRVQMEVFVELALRCVGLRPGEDKPRMIDVAKELSI